MIDSDMIRMGIGSQISYQSQLVKFNYKGMQIIDRMGFDIHHTYNVEISNMKLKQFDKEIETFVKQFDRIDDETIYKQI